MNDFRTGSAEGDYHLAFEESLQEASMLLHINHPTDQHGIANEGDLPQCGMIDDWVNQLVKDVGPMMLTYIAAGHPVTVASHLALASAIHSAVEVGFATGRVFQSHGFDVPVR
jgi:hypothetical protein